MADTYLLLLNDKVPVASFFASSSEDACKIAAVMRTRYRVAAKANNVDLGKEAFKLYPVPAEEVIIWRPTK